MATTFKILLCLLVTTSLSGKVSTQPVPQVINGFLSPMHQLVEVGGTVVLRCYSRSEPLWYKKDTLIRRGGHMLIIHDATREEMGRYSCLGKLMNGQDARGYASVFVGEQKHLIHPTVSTATENSDYYIISCDTTVPVRWFYNFRQIPLGWFNVYSVGENNQNLIFSPVEKRNTGEYSCYGPFRSDEKSMPSFFSTSSLQVMSVPQEIDRESTESIIHSRKLSYQKKERKVIRCSNPPPIQAATYRVYVLNGVEMAEYTCKFNYINIGGMTLKCTTENKWKGELPLCVDASKQQETEVKSTESIIPSRKLGHQVSNNNSSVIRCSKPPLWPSAKYRVYVHEGVERAEYSCKYNFKNRGGKMLTCTAKGWKGKLPICLGSHASIRLVSIPWIYFIIWALQYE